MLTKHTKLYKPLKTYKQMLTKKKKDLKKKKKLPVHKWNNPSKKQVDRSLAKIMVTCREISIPELQHFLITFLKLCFILMETPKWIQTSGYRQSHRGVVN